MPKSINHLFVLDFETVTENTQYFKQHQDTKVLLFHTKDLPGECEYTGVDLDDCMNYYMSLGHNIKVYCHNLSFDGTFILAWLCQRYKMVNKIKRYQVGFSALRQGSDIYEIKFHYYQEVFQRYYTIVFRCSYNICRSGVEDLGKSFGIKKYLDTDNPDDMYDVEPQDCLSKYDPAYINYCKRDVDIVRMALIELDKAFDFLKTEWPFISKFVWHEKLTAASISLKLQKEYVRFHYGDVWVRGFKHTNEENEFAKNFFYGGYTQFNVDIHDVETYCPNGVAIDINSAHPNSMTMKLPNGPINNMKDLDFHELGLSSNQVCEYYEIDFDRAESKYGGMSTLINWPKHNGIGNTNKNLRYLFQCGKGKCFYLKEEWEELCLHYDFENARVVNHYWIRADNYLAGFVHAMYQFKSDFKAKGKNGMSNVFKVILNGGYGIHAKRNDYEDYYVCESQEEYDRLKPGVTFTYNNKEYIVKDKRSDLHILDNQLIVIVETVIKPNANNMFIAATITAYSRIKLWQAMRHIGFENVAYADTDSIYAWNMPDNYQEFLEIDKYELGAWDVENKFSYIKVKGAKVYYIKNEQGEFTKAKFSGMNQRYLKDNLDERLYDVTKIPDCNLKPVRCKSGIILTWKPLTINKRNH